MIDLTGPARPWPDGLLARFAAAQEGAVRSQGCWNPARPDGYPGLVERLAELSGAEPGRITVTGGVRQFAAQWAGRTRKSVLEVPGFRDIAQILASGSRVQRASWGRFAGIARAACDATTFWLTSPSRNPDGRGLTGDEERELAAIAAAGHEVVVNQVYLWFAGTAEPPAGTWAVTSLSKLCGAGSALGWVTRPDAGRTFCPARGCGPAMVWQRAWARFLDARTLSALRCSCAEPTVAAARAFAARTGELLGWDLPGGGFAVLLACDGVSEESAVGLLAEAGLRVSPGSAFDAPVASVRVAFSGVTAREAADAGERMARLARRCPPGVSLRPWHEGNPVPDSDD